MIANENGQTCIICKQSILIGDEISWNRRGESLHTQSTGTVSFRPDGFTHIPVHAGLSYTRDESLRWAQEFALTLASEN